MYLQGLSAAPNPNCQDIHGNYMEWEARKFCPPPSTLLPMANDWWRCCMPPPAAAPAAPPANVTVHVPTTTNVQTQVSPQISPVFVQQDQPQNSGVNAGTSQTQSDPALIALLRSVAERETSDRQAAQQAQRDAEAMQAAQDAEARARALATGAPVGESPSYGGGGGGAGGAEMPPPGAEVTTAGFVQGLPAWLIPVLIGLGVLAVATGGKKSGATQSRKTRKAKR